MQKFGGPVGKTIYLKGAEAHKLHQAFTVATGAEVRNGQPVKLDEDGEVMPAASEELRENIIGYSIHDGKEGERVTIVVKAFAIIYCKSLDAFNAGKVSYGGQNTTDPVYMNVASSDIVGTYIGWAIDKATAANQVVRVMVY